MWIIGLLDFARYHFCWFLSLNTKNRIQPGKGTPIQCPDYHLSITSQQIFFELCGFPERVSNCTFLEAKWGLSLTIKGTLHIVDAYGVKPITITMTDKQMIKKVIHYYSLQARLNVEFLLGNTWHYLEAKWWFEAGADSCTYHFIERIVLQVYIYIEISSLSMWTFPGRCLLGFLVEETWAVPSYKKGR